MRSTKYKVQQQIQEIPETVYETGASGFNPYNIGLRNSLLELKPECRELIELSYVKGYTQEEMSEMLQIPLGTVKRRKRGALIQLCKIFKG